ncbi:hypothetical protein CEUSTIGMA_g1502.t1 [Chlamydomonas eustigma]|uniref:Uncharacterized protein n=1 Tax=Chlamydomonas eustigma TaxID=1157962 RepID=A0A250WTU3_9CHLO|nr:hypothetical protein CEUSTIGMA_g1502.t1 [Chlamydomonas eustigma]|eukprot:GAX74052.1 hypothetical protein CEUSTIGMA_g1502.t1 [Chlamydomonas eustigma]
MECDSEYIIGNNREDQKAAAEVPKEEQVEIVGVVDDQDVVAGSKITIPEEVLSSFDLDVVLSTGIHIDVETEEQVPAAHATISRTYLAQIDCHQVPDGTLYGAIHYIMENMEDFNEVFSGCKMTTWRPQPELQRIKLLVVRSKEELTDDVAPKKVSWQPPAVSLTEVKPDEVPFAEHSAKHPATQEETSAQAVHATPFRRALVRPGHNISIPVSFLNDNYNIETVLSSGLHVQVDADGVLDDDIDDLRLLKDSSADGSWMQYKAEGMSKLFERYPLWEIKQWRKVDLDNICVHLIRPTQDWLLTDATAANDDINEAEDDQQAVTATHGPAGLDDAGAWEEEDYKHVIVGSAEPGSMLDDEVKAKSFLIPRVKVVIPRRFMEQVMNTKAVLKNGLSLVIVMHDEKNNRESSHAPPSVLAKVHVSVEQFRHAQGYSQYRIDGLKPVCEQYNGWRIFSWVKMDETTAQLRINKADAVVQVKAHDGGADSSGQHPNMTDGQAVAPSGSGVNNNPSILGVPRVPVWLRQNQAVSVPRPFMEHLLAVDSVLDNGLNLEVQPEGKLPLPRLLCNVICYKNERGWAQYRIQQDLKSITMQYNGWGVVNWECIDPTTARLVICPPGSEEPTGKTQPLQAATTPLDKGADVEGGDVPSEAVRLSASDEPVASNQQAAVAVAVAVADVPVVEGGSGRRASKGKPSVNEAQNADKPTFVLHRSTKCITLMSPDHFIHVPRTFFQDNYDVDMICQKGLKIQVEANGVIDPEMATACVASYQNNSGYSYFRLLAFKATCRKYRGWRVDSWEVVDEETVKMRISGPFASEEEATLNDAEGEGAPKGRRKRQASVWQEEEEEEEELPVSRQTSNRHAGNPRHVQQKQQEQEEVQGMDEEPVTEQPIKAVAPFSSSDFLPDQCTAIQAALRDLAAQHCLNVRSFRDMVLPSPVSLPVATQTEIMSIPFNPGFFEAHFQHCKLPKHITLILNKDGELLEDRYESRILQTSSSRDKSASQEYLFRLPHPLRQEGAGWDIVGLTKVLDGSIMLHLFRPVSGRRGGRKKKKLMADQEDEPTRGKGDAGGGVGYESMEELQEDHDAAMAIMTLAQAVTSQPPDSNFNNSADPAGPLPTNYQQGLPRASNSQQGLPRASNSQQGLPRSSKEQGGNGNAEFEPVPSAAMTGVEGYMTGMQHQQQPAAMRVEDLIAGMQQLPQDAMNLQQGQMEASWGSAGIDMQAAQMLSGHAAEHVGMQQQLLGQLGMSMNLAPSQQQQQQLVMAVGPGGERYLMPVSQGLGQGYASSVPALMTGPDGNQVLVMIPQQQLLQQQQQRLYAAGPSTDGSRYILSSHTGQAGADGSRHSETIEALLQQQQQQVELEQQQAALHSLGQQQQQLSPEHQLLVHLGHGQQGSRQVSSLNLSSHRQNVVQGVDSEGAGVPPMLHNDQHIDQLHNDRHMKHEASHSLEHNHVAGSYHAQQQQQGNPSVVWNGQSLQLVQGGGLPPGLVVGGGRVSNGGGGGGGAGGMILTAGGGGAGQLLMLGSGGGGGLLTMLPNGQLVALQGGSHLQSPEGDNLGDMLRGSSITGGGGNGVQVLQMNPSGHAGGLLPLGTHQGQQGRVSLLGGGGPQQQQGSFSFGTAHQALQAAGGGLLQHQEGSGQHGGAQPLIMQMHGSGGHLVSLQQQLGGGGMMQALPHQQQQAMFMASHQGDQQQHDMFTTGGQQDRQHGMFMSCGGQQEQQAPRW